MGRLAQTSMIRLATEQDIPEILRVFGTARAYMRATGNPTQWAGEYPNEYDIRHDLVRGQCYVLEDDGIHAVFAFLRNGEPTYNYIEGQWLTDGMPYATLHRVANDGALSGVVRAACEFALREFEVVRIDTHENNKPMQAALTKIGFRNCGTIYLENGEPRLAFELVNQ